MPEHLRKLQVRPDFSDKCRADVVSLKTSGFVVESLGCLGELIHSLFGLFFYFLSLSARLKLIFFGNTFL